MPLQPTTKTILFICTVLLAFASYGQPLRIVKGSMQFPIKPGAFNSLTGNMGELRGNHYHGGLDIRTEYRTGLPVYASADGYIQKVIVDSQGYGWVMFVKHNDGFITVYAHLSGFMQPVAEYMTQVQYQRESFQTEVIMRKNQFPVHKGDVIAYSGNTGSSGGPHLHYEIRDSTDAIYNPLLFGFSEVRDNKDPYFTLVGVRPVSVDARINGYHERTQQLSTKRGDAYAVEKPFKVWGTVALDAIARDRLTDGSQKASPLCMDIQVDGRETYYHNMTTLSAVELKQINNHIAYDVFRQMGGEKFQKCYVADGNVLSRFRAREKLGYITIKDTLTHKVTVNISDAYGNEAKLHLVLKGERPQVPDSTKGTSPRMPNGKSTYAVNENTMRFSISNLGMGDRMAAVYTDKGTKFTTLAYRKGGNSTYLWDLRLGLPDSIMAGGRKARFNFVKMIPPQQKTQVSTALATVNFEEYSLFDTLYLEMQDDTATNIVSIGDGKVAVYNPILFSIKPGPGQSFTQRDKVSVYQVTNKEGALRYVGGQWEGDYMRARLKYFGKFKLVEDVKPPKPTLIKADRNNIIFKIADNLSGIKSWRCTVNGKWVLMNYEHKANLLTSKKLNESEPFAGELVFELTDNAGNVAVFKKNL